MHRIAYLLAALTFISCSTAHLKHPAVQEGRSVSWKVRRPIIAAVKAHQKGTDDAMALADTALAVTRRAVLKNASEVQASTKGLGQRIDQIDNFFAEYRDATRELLFSLMQHDALGRSDQDTIWNTLHDVRRRIDDGREHASAAIAALGQKENPQGTISAGKSLRSANLFYAGAIQPLFEPLGISMKAFDHMRERLGSERIDERAFDAYYSIHDRYLSAYGSLDNSLSAFRRHFDVLELYQSYMQLQHLYLVAERTLPHSGRGSKSALISTANTVQARGQGAAFHWIGLSEGHYSAEMSVRNNGDESRVPDNFMVLIESISGSGQTTLARARASSWSGGTTFRVGGSGELSAGRQILRVDGSGSWEIHIMRE